MATDESLAGTAAYGGPAPPPGGSSSRERVIAVAALGGVFAVAALAYWWTRAPLYNPPGTIDAWLYTAFFTNFDVVYERFANTYYGARLPWIVPGRVLYNVLPIDAAYWVLHGLTFVGGIIALYLLVRRHLGLAAAVVGAAALALTPMYWNAHYWDYVDGVTIALLLAGLCFGLPLTSGRRRALSLGAAGIFFAAAVSANVFVLLVGVIYPLLYVFVQPARGVRGRALMALGDLAALLLGAAVLVVALGLYAHVYGGPFLYFEPQIDFARAGVGETYKIPGYEWLRGEPRLLVPFFLMAVATPFLVLGRRLPAAPFSAGAVAGLAFLTSAYYGWEFLGGGSLLEHTFYTSYMSMSITLTIASIAALAVGLTRSSGWANVGVAATTTAAAVVALVLIYDGERGEWTGRAGARITLVLMAVAGVSIVAALLVRRSRVGPVLAVAAVGAVVLSTHFAISSSYGTWVYGASAPGNRDLYDAAFDHVDFLNGVSSPEDPLPAFWYDGKSSEFTSIQSMYFYAYTAISWDFPEMTAELRERLNTWKPESLVVLCETRDCDGATGALRRAGLPYAEQRAERIARGSLDFWVVWLARTASD